VDLRAILRAVFRELIDRPGGHLKEAAMRQRASDTTV